MSYGYVSLLKFVGMVYFLWKSNHFILLNSNFHLETLRHNAIKENKCTKYIWRVQIFQFLKIYLNLEMRKRASFYKTCQCPLVSTSYQKVNAVKCEKERILGFPTSHNLKIIYWIKNIQLAPKTCFLMPHTCSK